MIAKSITILFFMITSLMATEPAMYSKEYHNNGTLKAEGWMMGSQKIKYWKFYHLNGSIASEGHYTNNQKSNYWYFYDEQGNLIKEGHYESGNTQNWWIFHDIARKETRKIQYADNLQHGFCLVYKNKKLNKVEKYVKDQLQGEWKSISAFRRDNPDVPLN